MQDKAPEGAAAGSQNPLRASAVALSMGPAGQAPAVVAKGYGAAAESIIELARASGLHVHASPELVKLLMHVDFDTQIPPALYLAVAEILTWLHQLEVDSNNTL